MNTSTLSANLRRLRSAKGLSQVALAKRAGVSLHTYRNIEVHGRPPEQTSTLGRLAAALGSNTAELMMYVRPLRAVRFRDGG